MIQGKVRRVVLTITIAIPAVAIAQKSPAVRQLGRLEHVTTDSLASVNAVLALRDGRTLVQDRIGRRVLLFDSTLAHPTIIADTTSATANAYGGSIAKLIRFRGDSALLIDASSLSMAVIDPAGKMVRMMAIPRAEDAQAIAIGGQIDDAGHLVYFNALGSLPGFLMLGVGDAVYSSGKPTNLARFNAHTDSAWLIRIDLSSRVVDSLAPIHIPRLDRDLKTDANGGLVSVVTTPDPVPVADDWTMLPDGTVAIVRARDYHIDWYSRTGKSSTPPLPFDWRKLDDARKKQLIDSTVARWQGQYDDLMHNGRGGRGPIPGLAPLVAGRPSLESLPTYARPFETLVGGGSPIFGDAEGNVWIRTTVMLDGRPVYDVVNRRGVLFDRVQLPAFRTIAGFGPGVIYMAVKDAGGKVRLERARIR